MEFDLVGYVAVKTETHIGRKVDLRTPEDLSRYFRKEVVESAEVQYVQ